MSQLCNQCAGELGHPSMPDNAYTHYCYFCKQCAECAGLVALEDILWCEKYRSSLASQYGSKNVHCACLAIELRSSIEDRKIEITQRELDLLNVAHLMVQPNISLSIDTNVKEAEIKGINWFNSLPSLDEKFLALRRMESLAACFSLLMKKEPGTTKLRIDLNAASSKRFQDAVRAESKKDAKRIRCTKCNDMFLEPEIVEHFKSCVGAPPKTAAKTEKRKRTTFEKAVDLSLKYGLTVSEAIATTKALFLMQGQEITYSEDSELKEA